MVLRKSYAIRKKHETKNGKSLSCLNGVNIGIQFMNGCTRRNLKRSVRSNNMLRVMRQKKQGQRQKTGRSLSVFLLQNSKSELVKTRTEWTTRHLFASQIEVGASWEDRTFTSHDCLPSSSGKSLPWRYFSLPTSTGWCSHWCRGHDERHTYTSIHGHPLFSSRLLIHRKSRFASMQTTDPLW